MTTPDAPRPAVCDHTYPPTNRDGTCPSCGKPRPAANVIDMLEAGPVAEFLQRGAEATGLLNDLVTAKKLRLDAEEWQLVWDRVFRFLARAAADREGCTHPLPEFFGTDRWLHNACPACVYGQTAPGAPRPVATDEWCACDRAGGQVHPYRTNLAVHEGRSCPETRVVPPRPAATVTDVTDVTDVIADWLRNGYDDTDDTTYQASRLTERLAEAGIGDTAEAERTHAADVQSYEAMKAQRDAARQLYAEKADPIRPAHDGHGPLRCHDGCPAYASFMAEMHDQMRPAAPDAPRPAANVTDILAAHQRTLKPGGPCRCGEWPQDDVRRDTWMDHVAAALAEAGIGPVANTVTTAYHDNIVNEAQREIHRLEGAVAEAERRALGKVRAGLRTGPHLMNEDDHWIALPYVLDLLDRVAAEQAEKPTST